jgi:hypothetical protein
MPAPIAAPSAPPMAARLLSFLLPIAAPATPPINAPVYTRVILPSAAQPAIKIAMLPTIIIFFNIF